MQNLYRARFRALHRDRGLELEIFTADLPPHKPWAAELPPIDQEQSIRAPPQNKEPSSSLRLCLEPQNSLHPLWSRQAPSLTALNSRASLTLARTWGGGVDATPGGFSELHAERLKIESCFFLHSCVFKLFLRNSRSVKYL